MKKRLKLFLTIAVVFALALGTAACGSNDGGEETGGDSFLDRMEKKLDAQGRSYDKLTTGTVGETLSTAFFDFTVDSVKAADELGEYTPEAEDHKFIAVEVSVTNTMDQVIPVGNYDFSILWDGDDELIEEDQYPYETFMEGMYPDNGSLNPKETLSGTVVFSVPKDVMQFTVVYEEIYDDEFKGDTYMVECEL